MPIEPGISCIISSQWTSPPSSPNFPLPLQNELRCASARPRNAPCGRDIPGSSINPSPSKVTPALPGDLAVIFDDKRRFLAVGLYDPTSPIRVRILQSREPATINADWFRGKLVSATRVRASLEAQDTTGYRLVHGENDGLPGLVLDRYADALVLKLYTPAWIPHLKEFCDALAQVSPATHLILRLSRALQKQNDLLHGLSDGMTLTRLTPPSLILFRENGLTFESDPIHGQKTGFFLDQRDNRARVETLSKNKSVLNLFSYTGGFSVYAARAVRDKLSAWTSAHRPSKPRSATWGTTN